MVEEPDGPPKILEVEGTGGGGTTCFRIALKSLCVLVCFDY